MADVSNKAGDLLERLNKAADRLDSVLAGAQSVIGSGEIKGSIVEIGDAARAEPYIGGRFATIYLAPYNHHRVHVPTGGTLVALHYEPGTLYSVNITTAALVDALYVKNERLVCHFESPQGPYALVFVGALNVGSVSLTGVGEVLPRKDHRAGPLPLPASRHYSKGDELGWFNMGSTVVLLYRAGNIDFVDGFCRGAVVRMGERIARHRLP